MSDLRTTRNDTSSENLEENYVRSYLSDDKDMIRELLIDFGTWTSCFGDRICRIDEITKVVNPVLGTISFGILASDTPRENESPRTYTKYYKSVFQNLHDQLGSGDVRSYISCKGILGACFR